MRLDKFQRSADNLTGPFIIIEYIESMQPFWMIHESDGYVLSNGWE